MTPLELGTHPKPTQIAEALVKDGLAVEAEGDLVQRRPVSPIIVVPSQTQKV